jgi:hypothetical protein
VVLPELFAGVLACNAAEDLLSTWVLVLELGQIVDILVHDDVQVGGLIMRLNVADGEGF